MSGGTWNYLGRQIQDLADGMDKVKAALEFLEAAEHELDWGLSHDSCLRCARKRVVAGLEQLFTGHLYSEAAIAVARDYKQNQCEECMARQPAISR